MRSAPGKSLPQRVIHSILALAAASTATAHAADPYTLYSVGLYSSSTTSPSYLAINGQNNQAINFTISTGAMAGTSTRYTNSTAAATSTLGGNQWYYDPSSHNTYKIGFTGDANTAMNAVTGTPNNTQAGTVRGINAAGEVFGTSAFYKNNSSPGNQAWIYTPPTAANPSGVTTAIRLTDPGDDTIVYQQGIGSANGNGRAENVSISVVTSSGYAFGVATRYDSVTYGNQGSNAWVYKDGQTKVIGIPDNPSNPQEYTRINLSGVPFDFYQFPILRTGNANGAATGLVNNYGSMAGSAEAWVYDGTTTKAIGLAHSSDQPNYNSLYIASNEPTSPLSLTSVTGSSSTTGFHGNTAWIASISSGTTFVFSAVGTPTPNGGSRFFYNGGAGNTDQSYQNSNPSGFAAPNNNGQAIGSQSFYAPNSTSTLSSSSDALFFSGGTSNTTFIIGLTDTNHTTATSTTAFRNNTASNLNDAGFVYGTATRYSGDTAIGTDAWSYSSGMAPDANGNRAVLIGLVSSTAPGVVNADYTIPAGASTGTPGQRATSPSRMNAVGQVAGTSTHYLSDGTSAGNDTFLYTPGGTSVRLGLADVPGDTVHQYTNVVAPTGTKRQSAVFFLLDSGRVAGTATRYNQTTGATAGVDTYYYDGTTNTQVGLTGGIYLSSDGYTANCSPGAFNAASGLIAGIATRYNGGSASNGQDVWVHDTSATGTSPTTYTISLSVNSGTQAANATVQTLTDSGLLLGSYTKYSGSTSLGLFAYAFTTATGAFDLGINTTNFTDATWTQLASAVSINSGNIAGFGLLSFDSVAFASNNQSIYVIQPTATWIAAAPSNNWSLGTNWSGGTAPNGIGANATVVSAASSSPTVFNLSVPVTLGTLNFDNSTGKTISGAALTMQGVSGNGLITVMGAQSITAPLIFASATKITGPGNLPGNGSLTTGPIVNNSAMTVALATVTTGAITGTGSIAVNSGTTGTTFTMGTLTAASIKQDGSVSFAGNITILPHGTPKLASYIGGTLSGTGVMDLTNNDLLLATVSPTAAAALVSSGRIISSSTTINGTPDVCTLLVVSGVDYIAMHGSAALDDMTVEPGMTVIKYAIYGDTTLSGTVNINDYLAIDRAFLMGIEGAGWSSGDFNADGFVTAADYVLIDRGYAAQGGVNAAEMIALHQQQFGVAYTAAAIPEPASLTLLALGTAGLCRRRKSREGR